MLLAMLISYLSMTMKPIDAEEIYEQLLMKCLLCQTRNDHPCEMKNPKYEKVSFSTLK